MMDEPFRIWLAGTIRGKGRPRFIRSTGRAYTPAQTVNYEAALRMAGQAAMGSTPPIDGPIHISMVAFFEIPKSTSKAARLKIAAGTLQPTKKPDWDNIAKLTDALNQIVWIDDKQIVEATFSKRYADTPGLRIVVTKLPSG